MKKLKFITRFEGEENPVQVCSVMQSNIIHLLLNQLQDYGFTTHLNSNSQNLNIHVEDNQIILSVQCEKNDQAGQLCCHLSAYTDEKQVWFKKIETQSMIKQLANAIESTLKNDDSFSELRWLE